MYIHQPTGIRQWMSSEGLRWRGGGVVDQVSALPRDHTARADARGSSTGLRENQENLGRARLD